MSRLCIKMKYSVILLIIPFIYVDCLEKGSIVQDTLMKVLDTCLVSRLNTVIMTPDVIEAFYQTPLSSMPIPVVTMDDKFQPTTKKLGFFSGQQQPATFILGTDSGLSVYQMLQSLKSSVWWSIEGMLIVVESSHRGCNGAFENLHLAWKFNLLSALYLCNQANEGVMLYTYNPYTDRAPHPWTQVENPNKPDDRWTLYRQSAIAGRVDCDTLDYDKLEFLDGYQVKAVTSKLIPGMEKYPKNDKVFDIDNMQKQLTMIGAGPIVAIYFGRLNVSLAVHFGKSGWYIDGKATGNIDLIKKGKYDVSLLLSHLNGDFNFIYPLAQTELKIITQGGKFLRPEEKIRAFSSSTIVYLSAGVLLMTLIVMVFYMKRGLSLAALEILRMTLSTAILNRLSRSWIRIYLVGVLHLIIVINATFQGNLSAFLTKPERHNVNTMAELNEQQYQIYIPGHLANMFKDWPQFEKGKVHVIEDRDCGEYVHDSISAACINYVNLHAATSKKYNFHILEETAAKPYLSYWCRDDWPIGQKLNSLTLRIIESGLPEYWRKMFYDIPLEKMKFSESQETEPVIRPITLDDLAFAFPILALGLTLATIVFIGELIIGRKKLRSIRNRHKTRPRTHRSDLLTHRLSANSETREALRIHKFRPDIAREVLAEAQLLYESTARTSVAPKASTSQINVIVKVAD